MASTSLSHASVGPDFRSLSRQPPSDPDIQATLSDFLTYTEHFPSHLTRALTLIKEQRTRCERSIKAIHDDTTAYSILPSIRENRPDPIRLRRDVSRALEEAVRASSMALVEATRLDEECARETRRLNTVLEKLRAQPMPPSRDPTPEQQTIGSPEIKRERRLSTRVEDGRTEKQSRRMNDKAVTKLRGRKIMVPGEVLPPPDPNAPLESMSDWTTPRNSPPLEEPPATEKRAVTTSRARSRTPKAPKLSVEPQRTPKSRGPRAPGQPGTNAHSAVAGISTSNALLALTQPPEDAPKGSKWLPWLKLTEWEMAKLRKRMKKNAIWVPSPTMVRRELKNLGRGVAGRDAAKLQAEATGAAFADEPNEPDPTKVMLSGEENDQINAALGPSAVVEEDDDADAELINRGMRLNEAKKLKRQRLLEEQALQAQLAREQGVEAPVEVNSRKTASMSPEAQKKRKRESTPAASTVLATIPDTPDPLTRPGPQPKKLKIAAPSSGTLLNTSKVPLAPAGSMSSSRSSTSRSRRAATPQETRKPSTAFKNIHKAVSEEPPSRRESLRRSSTASMPSGNLSAPTIQPPPTSIILNAAAAAAAATSATGASAPPTRRSKRPAPGIVRSDDGESAKVGFSKRKKAPGKRTPLKRDPTSAALDPNAPGGGSGTGNGNGNGGGGGGLATSGGDPADEDIDPDEPRYCICGDVSWGTMIACDNEDNCEKEWFHLDCVQLDDMPPRRTKWYCPDCRKKLKVGQASKGVVGRGAGTQGGR